VNVQDTQTFEWIEEDAEHPKRQEIMGKEGGGMEMANKAAVALTVLLP
jgi:hypothetical protein